MNLVISAAMFASFGSSPPAVHVVRSVCVSTTVTRSAVARSTFEVVGAKGRYEPFEVEYARPSTRVSFSHLFTLPPFQPGEEAFWLVIECRGGRLLAVTSPEQAKAFLPTPGLLTFALKNGERGSGEREEVRVAEMLASLISASVEPQMRTRLPQILRQHRNSTDEAIRGFVKWLDAREPEKSSNSR